MVWGERDIVPFIFPSYSLLFAFQELCFQQSYQNNHNYLIILWNINIKNELKDIIDKENKKKPLSDQKICDILNLKGINISRRTVAKYREELNIPGSSIRKEI